MKAALDLLNRIAFTELGVTRRPRRRCGACGGYRHLFTCKERRRHWRCPECSTGNLKSRLTCKGCGHRRENYNTTS